MKGWPEHRAQVNAAVLPYHSYRDCLTVQDGIILRGKRVVIPQSLRSEMREKAHAGHLGINACLRRAKELLFWPGMSADIRQHIESCETCAAHSLKQPAEPLKLHDNPDRPWSKVGIDIFTISGRNYLVTVDYFSSFFETDYLADTLSTTVVAKCKMHFARYGIPDEVHHH